MTVTAFLFTDIVGSTALLRDLGDAAMDQVRRAHFGVLRDAIAASGGREVKNLGDGLMVAFANASDAVACAAAMQRNVERQGRRSGVPLGMRIGIDLGETTEEDGDYFGGPVVVAKRLCDAAGSGEVLVTDMVRALAAARSGYRFGAATPIALKGIPEPANASLVEWRTDADQLPLPVIVTARGEDPPPFVGRQGEWAALQVQWTRACQGCWRVVFLAGEPGVGKTRLACEFARHAWGSGAVVLAGRSSEDLALPYQPFIEALQHYVLSSRPEDLRSEIGPVAPLLAKLVPALLDRVPGLEAASHDDAEAERFQLFEAVTAVLAAISARAPVLLLLDDLQWADQASLLLLKHLATSTQTAGVLVLATYRDLEVPRTHPLVHALEDLRRARVEHRLTLEGLDADDAARFFDTFLGEPLAPALVGALWRETGGNPLFMEEVARTIREAEILPCVDAFLSRDRHDTKPGRVELDLDCWSVPVGVKETLWQRLRRLSPGALDAMSVASVIGVEFDLELLALVLGMDEEELLELLDEAVFASLLTELLPQLGRYAFAHGLIRHTLYEEHTANRRAQLHARVGDALEQLSAGDPRPPYAALAYQYSRSGPRRSTKLLAYALAAGEEAMELYAYEDAEYQFAKALHALDTTRRRSDGERARALIGLAAARRAEGDPVISRSLCLKAAELARACGDAELLARAAIGLALPGAAIGMDFGAIDHERVELLEEALAHLPSASPLRLRTLVHLVFALHLSPLAERRRAAAEEAVATAEELGQPELHAAALAARHSTEWGRAPLSGRLSTSREMTRLAGAGGARQTELEGHIALAIDLLEAGDLDSVAGELAVIREQADTLRQPFYHWYSCTLDAACDALAGRYADGAARIADAIHRSGGALGRRPQWGRIAWECVTGWDLGTLDQIEAPLRTFVETFPDTPVLHAALAHVLCVLGRDEEARETASPWLEDPGSIAEDAMWLFTLALLAEVAWHQRDATAASVLCELLAPVSGRLVVVGSGVACFGAIDRSLGLMALTRGRHEDAIRQLERGLAMHQRLGARPWVARTQGALAAAHLERGGRDDDRTAASLLSAARLTAAEVGANGLTAWLDALGNVAHQPPG